jgi:hypothetical protein
LETVEVDTPAPSAISAIVTCPRRFFFGLMGALALRTCGLRAAVDILKA